MPAILAPPTRVDASHVSERPRTRTRETPEKTLRQGGRDMATIDVDALRDYMRDYLGTAMSNGFPAAMAELPEIDGMGPRELCERAKRMGVDLGRFATREDVG